MEFLHTYHERVQKKEIDTTLQLTNEVNFLNFAIEESIYGVVVCWTSNILIVTMGHSHILGDKR